jgi:hypothetical protein
VIAVGILGRVRQSLRERSIHQLVDSSSRHEAAGEFSEALIELDAALELARTAKPPDRGLLAGQQERRATLARRDVEAILERLRHSGASSFPMGEWLNLVARCEQDPDLSSVVSTVKQELDSSLRKWIEIELATAGRAFESGQPAMSLDACERIAPLLKRVPFGEQLGLAAQVEKLVTRLVAIHGVTIVAPEGRFVLGSQDSYLDGLLPVVVTALEGKGYLPYRKTSPWRELWRHASFQITLDLSEQFEGSYLSTENRLTRIEAHLSLSKGAQVVWQTRPTARSTVPLPNMSAFVASRVASSGVRSEEVEKLLYRDARGQIDAKVSYALGNLPAISPVRESASK